MRLKVGELAKRAGVTVRALHHYDSIGLLRPSARSEAGYRLYDRDDVARLHAIQALRGMGVPLAEVERLLGGGTAALPSLLARQIEALDESIARSRALRDRLGMLQEVLARGSQPGLDDWLSSLSLMATYEQYFSAAELRRAFARWKRCETEWPPLLQALHAAMERGVPADAVELQPLLQQWLDLCMRWMDGDLDFLGRWSRMLREQPALPRPPGMDLALLDYVDEALRQRTAVLALHVGPELHQHLAGVRPAWQALVARGQRLMDDGVPPEADAARELARDWQALKARTVGDDGALWSRLVAAYEQQPLLQAGLPLTPALRRYVEQAGRP